MVQAVHPELRITIPFDDLAKLAPEDRERKVVRLAGGDARRPFDLSVGPLLRARLFKFSEQDYRLYLTVHSIIHDGTSLYAILLPELGAIYDAFLQGGPSPLGEPLCQYADYALWQTRMLDNDIVARQMDYWRERLSRWQPPQPPIAAADRPAPGRSVVFGRDRALHPIARNLGRG